MKKPKYEEISFFELFRDVFPKETERIIRMKAERNRRERIKRGEKLPDDWIEFDETKRPMKPKGRRPSFKP